MNLLLINWNNNVKKRERQKELWNNKQFIGNFKMQISNFFKYQFFLFDRKRRSTFVNIIHNDMIYIVKFKNCHKKQFCHTYKNIN